jgi:lipoic acid synthetase
MLGFGEDQHEVVETMIRLRDADCDLLTLGQYLRPTKKHAPVREYITPERFDEYRALGEELGFLHVAAGPLVRSSYKAGEFFAERFIRERNMSTSNKEDAQ